MLIDGRTIEYLPEMIGEGGMKRVYMTADRQSVLCFFKDQQKEASDPNRMARLEAILESSTPRSTRSMGTTSSICSAGPRVS